MIPDKLLVIDKENFAELYRKAYNEEKPTPNAFTRYDTDCLYDKLKPYDEHSSAIRKLAKDHGFSAFQTSNFGGSAFNIKTGVRIHWRRSWFEAACDQLCRTSSVGYAFNYVWFDVRKAKKVVGWKMSEKYTYAETSYIPFEQGFSFHNSEWKGRQWDEVTPRGVKMFTKCESANAMFEEAFKYGQTLKGDEPVTVNTLKKKTMQNLIMTSVFDCFKDEVYGEGLERCKIKLSYQPAKAPEDSCRVALSFIPFYHSTKEHGHVSPLMSYLIDHHPVCFELSTTDFGIGYGTRVRIDFSNPLFDIDRLRAIVSKVIKRHYETALYVSNNRLQIKQFKTLNQDRDADDKLLYQQELVDAFCEPAL